MWQDWTNGILGLVILAVATFSLMGTDLMTGTTLAWALAATGLVVAAIGFWGAMENTTDAETKTSSLRHA